MTNSSKDIFLTFFPDHVFRYIDLTGESRPPVSSETRKDELNINGYESYFTVNGFKDAPNAQKNNCSSINAFFIDIDGRKDLDELEEIKKKLDPTFILETQNGYHLYWCLDEPIFKEEVSPEEWEASVALWEKIEQDVVTALNADPKVKDLTRILRVPKTWYWKKTGDKYKTGTDGVFKIKPLYKRTGSTYTMQQVQEAFPSTAIPMTFDEAPTNDRAKEKSEANKNEFFERVLEEFPMSERDSFNNLLKGDDDSTLPRENCANDALLVTASLMRQAGWTKKQAIEHTDKVGWHGIEKEAGGRQEIKNTINSAFNGKYTYWTSNEFIAHNSTPEEELRMNNVIAGVTKARKEVDKIRFTNYERTLLEMHPHMKKNEIGLIFDYKDGVYKMLSDQDLSDMVLNGLYEDLLGGFRTKRNVSDKIACLQSIIPEFKLSNDGGRIINVKNGLLNIETRELVPHTPTFVSLVQYPVEYDPAAKCPTWENCVADWMKGPEQEEKMKLIQQFCGYILSSSMLYDKALFMVGDGGNGKSTFIDTISMIIGPESTSHIDLEGLYAQFGFKGLIGKRLNIIEEVQGNYYQSNKLKKLVSGESVTTEMKFKDQFTFRPQTKFVFSVNLLPRVDDTSSGTERRICAVNFLNNYRENPNVKLRSSVGLLAQELPGILNWMIEGAKLLADDGEFVLTKEQIAMMDEYREENSSVEGFLSQCVILDPHGTLEGPELYKEYKLWSVSEGGRKPKMNMTFQKEVKAYGAKGNRFTFEKRQYAGGEARFIGVALSPHWIKIRDGTSPQDYPQRSADF